MLGQGGEHGKDRVGKSRHRLLVISLAINLFLLSFIASREAWHYIKRHEIPPGPPPPSEMLHEAAKALSPAGRDAVHHVLEADATRLSALHEALQHAHQAAEKLYSADPFDADAYRQAVAAQLDGGRALFGEISRLLLELGPQLSQSDRELLMQHMKGPGRPPPKKP